MPLLPSYPLFSDNSPCILDLAVKLPTAGSKPFIFPNYLTKHPQFVQLIHDAWIQFGNIANLREGDFNTTYFHRICQTRTSYNAIRAFLIGVDQWITEPQEMSENAVNHFQSVLGPTNNHYPGIVSAPHWIVELTGFIFPHD